MEFDPRFLWDYELSEADRQKEEVKRWYLARVLSRGGLSDIQAIGLATIREVLPDLRLPNQVRRFWNIYFKLLDQKASPSRS